MSALPISERRLILDGGKTKTEAAIVDGNGSITARFTGPGLPIIESPNGFDGVVDSLRVTIAGLGSPEPFHTVCIGLNGILGTGSGPMSQATQALQTVVHASRYIVTSDVVTSFVGAHGVNAGVVIAAGTGSIILAIGDDGAAHPVDGYGPFGGDRGSGYDIGRQGVYSALRFADGVSGSESIYNQAIEQFGSITAMMSSIYGSDNPTKVVASFSHGVATAAASGDPIAIAIWDRAGKDLAEGAVAAARAASLLEAPFMVAITGGLLRAGSRLQAPLVAELARLAPHARISDAGGGALGGCIVLALSDDDVFPDLINTVDASIPSVSV
ncbi:MAG: N-acetylglucosamine kinase [Rhodoglobus sp.]